MWCIGTSLFSYAYPIGGRENQNTVVVSSLLYLHCCTAACLHSDVVTWTTMLAGPPTQSCFWTTLYGLHPAAWRLCISWLHDWYRPASPASNTQTNAVQVWYWHWYQTSTTGFLPSLSAPFLVTDIINSKQPLKLWKGQESMILLISQM